MVGTSYRRRAAFEETGAGPHLKIKEGITLTEANTSGGSYSADTSHEGRDTSFMDIDRMINEGLGGGTVSMQNGLIEESTTDTMDHPESVLDDGDAQ